WTFDGGLIVPASSSPSIVPIPFSNPAAVDPEEAFIASISSCHMLWFLSLAAARGFTVESYSDQATGLMTKSENNVTWVSAVKLRPKVKYGAAKQPSPSDEHHLHHEAHEKCFIANSVRTQITIEAA